MNINLKKINEIYGKDVLELISDNIDDVSLNIKYLKSIGFDDVADIFESYPLIFICSKNEFKEKVDKLISNLGSDYIENLENEMGLWGELE